MTKLLLSDTFEENTRHASSFRLICENALAPLNRIDKSFDEASYSSVLRGAYCLIVAGVDSYLTNFFYDGVSELSRLESKGQCPADFSLNAERFLLNRCRVNKKEITDIGVGSTNLDKEMLFSKVSGVTFNKSFQFVEIYNLLFERIDESKFWDLCAGYVPAKSALWLRQTWSLVVQRRNIIMHSGDLDIRGVALQPFESEFVENALLGSAAVISVFEKQSMHLF